MKYISEIVATLLILCCIVATIEGESMSNVRGFSIMDMEHKICTVCRMDKALEEFVLQKERTDGRSSACKACYAQKAADRKAANPEKAKRYDADRYATPEGRARSRLANIKRLATPEGRAAHRLRLQVARATPEGRAASRRAVAKYQSANPEKTKRRRAAYLATPAGRAANSRAASKRRALEAGATIGDLKAIAAWESTWRTAKSVPCHWCGKKFAGKDMHSDHVIPITKGGPHCVENLAPSCGPCNQRKSNTLPDVFNTTLKQPRLFF